MKKLLLILIAFVSINVSNAQSKDAVVTNLSAQRFQAIVGNDKNGMLLDLRTTEEIKAEGLKIIVKKNVSDAKMAEVKKQILNLIKND